MKKLLIIAFIMVVILVSSFFITKIIIKKDLNNTSWQVIGWQASSISPSVASITLNLDNSKVSGNGGVNSYSGKYILGLNNKISFSNISSTEMASMNDEINKAESMYFNFLPIIKYYKIENNQLNLLEENKNVVLILKNVNN